MAGRVLKVWIRACDGVEGFEHFAREEAFWVFGGFVGHEAVDEGPSGRRGDDAAERGVEEIWILGDGILEASRAVFCEDFEINAVAVLLAEFVEICELGQLEEIVVAACDWSIVVGIDAKQSFHSLLVKITPCW